MMAITTNSSTSVKPARREEDRPRPTGVHSGKVSLVSIAVLHKRKVGNLGRHVLPAAARIPQRPARRIGRRGSRFIAD